MNAMMARLYQAARELGIFTPTELARAMEVSQQTLSNWERRDEISKDGRLRANKVLGVNIDWIESGQGDVFSEPNKFQCTTPESLAGRLAVAIAYAQVSQAKLARACELKPPSVSDWLSGKTKSLTGVNLLNASAFLGVNPEWLAEGKGNMLTNKDGQHNDGGWESNNESVVWVEGVLCAERLVKEKTAKRIVAPLNTKGRLLIVGDFSYSPRLVMGDGVLVRRSNSIKPMEEVLISLQDGLVVHCVVLEKRDAGFIILNPRENGQRRLIGKGEIASVDQIIGILPNAVTADS